MRRTLCITRRGTLHLYPANEACNLDAAQGRVYHVPDQGADDERMARAMNDSRYRRKCRRCFP